LVETLLDSALILFALFLVALNALFVGAEFALVRIRNTQVEQLIEQGRASARLVRDATRKLDGYLAVCQLGITIASIGLGYVAEPAFTRGIEGFLGDATGLPDGANHLVAAAIALSIVTFLHVVFGELAPKSVAIARPEGTSLFVAPFMKFFYYLFRPGVIVFNGTANAFVRLFGVPPASETEETHTEEEIRRLITHSTNRGILEESEEVMLDAVFDLADTVAREIMVPKPDVVSIPADTPLSELVTLAAEGTHTRYPVHEVNKPDSIIGLVHVKDVLRSVHAEGKLDGDTVAQNILRKVIVVPENRPIDEILADFQRQEIQMAIVIDEWGSFEGLITIEDILEEIVGEIRDEFDEEEPMVKALEDGVYAVDGRIPIQLVNETLDTEFESKDFDTIGGLVLGSLGRPPEVGDEISQDGHVLRVEEVDGARVAQVLIRETPEHTELRHRDEESEES
jgi:CBS domain containing-hemolysin-like protein